MRAFVLLVLFTMLLEAASVEWRLQPRPGLSPEALTEAVQLERLKDFLCADLDAAACQRAEEYYGKEAYVMDRIDCEARAGNAYLRIRGWEDSPERYWDEWGLQAPILNPVTQRDERGLSEVGCIGAHLLETARTDWREGNALVNVRTVHGNNSVWFAVSKKAPSVLEALLLAGADPDAGTHGAALRMAIITSAYDCARLLVKHGAALESPDERGLTNAMVLLMMRGNDTRWKKLLPAAVLSRTQEAIRRKQKNR